MDPSDVLAKRANALARVPARETAGETSRVLVATVGEQRIGFPMEHVLRVRPVGRCIPVPNAPPGIVGVAKVDGRIVAVFGARTWRGIPESPSTENPVLVLGTRESPLVLQVDSVSGTIDVPATASDMRGTAEPWLRAILDDVLVVDVLSLIALLSRQRVTAESGVR